MAAAVGGAVAAILAWGLGALGARWQLLKSATISSPAAQQRDLLRIGLSSQSVSLS
jgi:hypothetical protein